MEYSVYLYITTQMVLTFKINPPYYPHVSSTVSCPYTFTYIKYILKRKYTKYMWAALTWTLSHMHNLRLLYAGTFCFARIYLRNANKTILEQNISKHHICLVNKRKIWLFNIWCIALCRNNNGMQNCFYIFTILNQSATIFQNYILIKLKKKK